MICVALFTISSFLCGVAPKPRLARVFSRAAGRRRRGHGARRAGDARRHFPAEEARHAFSVYGLAVVFAPAIGPTLGGWITDNYSWHWDLSHQHPGGHRLAPAYGCARHGARARAPRARAGENVRACAWTGPASRSRCSASAAWKCSSIAASVRIGSRRISLSRWRPCRPCRSSASSGGSCGRSSRWSTLRC